jgi:sulfur relay (sulfurtransferase) complex TusBCD TusD component (DsrE family)
VTLIKKKGQIMKILIVIYSPDAETAWNAFRYANSALAYEDEVTVFLMGKGVECLSGSNLKFNVLEYKEMFDDEGGKVVGCGVCCESRIDTMPSLEEELACELGSMQQFYVLVKESDKVLTF